MESSQHGSLVKLAQAVANAAKSWEFVILDYADRVDPSDNDERMQNILLNHSMFAFPSIPLRGRDNFVISLLYVLYNEVSGRLAKWFVQNTSMIMVLAEVLNLSYFSADLDGTSESMIALVALLVADISKIPYFIALGLKTLASHQTLLVRLPQHSREVHFLRMALDLVLNENITFLGARLVSCLPSGAATDVFGPDEWSKVRSRFNDKIWHEIRGHVEFYQVVSEHIDVGIIKFEFMDPTDEHTPVTFTGKGQDTLGAFVIENGRFYQEYLGKISYDRVYETGTRVPMIACLTAMGFVGQTLDCAKGRVAPRDENEWLGSWMCLMGAESYSDELWTKYSNLVTEQANQRQETYAETGQLEIRDAAIKRLATPAIHALYLDLKASSDRCFVTSTPQWKFHPLAPVWTGNVKPLNELEAKGRAFYKLYIADEPEVHYHRVNSFSKIILQLYVTRLNMAEQFYDFVETDLKALEAGLLKHPQVPISPDCIAIATRWHTILNLSTFEYYGQCGVGTSEFITFLKVVQARHIDPNAPPPVFQALRPRYDVAHRHMHLSLYESFVAFDKLHEQAAAKG